MFYWVSSVCTVAIYQKSSFLCFIWFFFAVFKPPLTKKVSKAIVTTQDP